MFKVFTMDGLREKRRLSRRKHDRWTTTGQHHSPSWVARASGPIDERSSCSPTGMPAPASVFLVPSSKSMDERLSQEGISGGNPSTLQEMATPNQSTQSCVVAFVHSLVDSVSVRSCTAAQLGWIIIHRTALVARATARQSETLGSNCK